MFFGLTQLENSEEYLLATNLKVSWLSMSPLVSWFSMESTPGVYNFDGLDAVIKKIQNINLDCTPVLFAVNAFGDKRVQLIQKIGNQDMTGFLRSDSSIYWKLYPNDEEGTMNTWLNFVQKVVERYDNDGINDMPGLKYPIRNYHLLEEHPEIFIDTDSYIKLLKASTPIVRQAYPDAKIILAGLAGNYSRYFAYMDSFITDDDAGVINGVKHVKAWWTIHPGWQSNKSDFEKILQEGKDYYDIVDIHFYEEKETFLEGKVAWMKNKLNGLGVSKPIWCIEGGGPLKLTEAQHLAGDTQGDWYFGPYSDKENSEFVIKLHVMAAASGVERQHWGLSATPEGAYWSGPWHNMALATSNLQLKPSYFTFKLMVKMLKDFKSVSDLSTNEDHLYEFSWDNDKCYVAWSKDGNSKTINMQNYFSGESTIKVTNIITDLSQGTTPTEEQKSPGTITIGLTPVFISKNSFPVDVSETVLLSENFLYQNFPNPFNPETVIGWQIARGSYVTLKIYDVLGREMATLINEYEQAGAHNLKLNINNYNLSSGVYFYRLTADNFAQTKKLLLIK